ncbi:MAG TPA: MaoC/PaaZ C-terminal domain-containing protein [Solirubrobacterales bacterium]
MNGFTLTGDGVLRSRGRTITEADLVSFSALTGDWHPQHADAEWAKTSRFGERIAHGMLVLSYSIGLVGFDPEEVVALRGIDDLTFKRPVKIGETIRVEAQVDERKPLDDEHELVTLRWRVLASDKLAVRAKIQAVRRVAAGASAPANGADGEPAAAGAPNGPVQAAGAPVIDSSAELYGSQVLL